MPREVQHDVVAFFGDNELAIEIRVLVHRIEAFEGVVNVAPGQQYYEFTIIIHEMHCIFKA